MTNMFSEDFYGVTYILRSQYRWLSESDGNILSVEFTWVNQPFKLLSFACPAEYIQITNRL